VKPGAAGDRRRSLSSPDAHRSFRRPAPLSGAPGVEEDKGGEVGVCRQRTESGGKRAALSALLPIRARSLKYTFTSERE